MEFTLDEIVTAKKELNTDKVLIDSYWDSVELQVNKLKEAYKSNSEKVTTLYAAFDKMSNSFPDFIASLEECVNHLENNVIPSYEAAEK